MVNNIQKLGTVIHLHASIDGILQAIQNHPNAAKKIHKRPLLQEFDQARRLYDTRLPLYRQTASLSIDIEGKDISEVAREIKSLV